MQFVQCHLLAAWNCCIRALWHADEMASHPRFELAVSAGPDSMTETMDDLLTTEPDVETQTGGYQNDLATVRFSQVLTDLVQQGKQAWTGSLRSH